MSILTLYIMITVLHFFILRLFHIKLDAFSSYLGSDVMILILCSLIPIFREGQILMLLCQNVDADELLDKIFFVKR